jgi:integrase
VAQRHAITHTSPRAVVTAQDRFSSPIARTSRLKQNERGIWVIHYSQPDPEQRGRWRSATLSTRTTHAAEAQRQFDQWLREAQDQHAGVGTGGGSEATVEAICEAYLAAYDHRGGDPSQHRVLRAPRGTLGGHTPAALRDGALMGAHLTLRRREGISESTLRRELGALLAALRWGHEHGLCGEVPRYRLPPETPPRLKFLGRDDELRFWQAAQAWGQADKGVEGKALALFVALALDTAARREAICDLTWDRVDLSGGLLDFTVPGRRVTRKRRVVVPISTRLMPVLRAAAARTPVGLDGRPVGRVIGYNGNTMTRWFKQLAESVGLGWVTPHVCRHTWATLAAQDGISLFHIAKVMGDTVATVEKTYAKLTPHDLRDVINRRFA